ncbi:transcription initiation factor TFIID subunit 1-like isoform X2 [Teleopsis dalmanni]|uniref:transcription initiation factor TFIID subunit 1-like isoform X2 n=1 Tax=Teleopsis dalmanni TaxID=139649 RepID=UPI0018CF2386|nr:transcription initiation factor TFIID subunit 1-like isoform X2 [Teleopsis dalmanni]
MTGRITRHQRNDSLEGPEIVEVDEEFEQRVIEISHDLQYLNIVDDSDYQPLSLELLEICDEDEQIQFLTQEEIQTLVISNIQDNQTIVQDYETILEYQDEIENENQDNNLWTRQVDGEIHTEVLIGNQGVNNYTEVLAANQGENDYTELLIGNQDANNYIKVLAGNQGENDNAEFLIGNQGANNYIKVLAGNQGENDNTELLIGNQGANNYIKVLAGNQGENDNTEFLIGNQGENDYTEVLIGNQGENDYTEYLIGNQVENNCTELLIGDQVENNYTEFLIGNQVENNYITVFIDNQGENNYIYQIEDQNQDQVQQLIQKEATVQVLNQDDIKNEDVSSVDLLSRTDNTSLAIKCSRGKGRRIQEESSFRLDLKHALPVIEFHKEFMPTHLSRNVANTFYRPRLAKFKEGRTKRPFRNAVNVVPSTFQEFVNHKRMVRASKYKKKMPFYPETIDDLSAKDGKILLMEFSEEHPPLMNQVGMNSKIINYYKCEEDKSAYSDKFRYGEWHSAVQRTFLGQLNDGECLQTLENKLYRAPIYEHKVIPTDFLVVHSKGRYWIRKIDGLFTVGQLCPVTLVPEPSSREALSFIRNFLKLHIYRLFQRSTFKPPRLRMEDIKGAFPELPETTIRKHLKQVAHFKRHGNNINWWIMRNDICFPTLQEICTFITPEKCCAHYSMVLGQYRLKAIGFGQEHSFNIENVLQNDVKSSPWNTTRAYIRARSNQCILHLTGSADPTGCGLGFSYERITLKELAAMAEKEIKQNAESCKFMEADFRCVPVEMCRCLLRKLGMDDKEIMKIDRWQLIDIIRTLFGEKYKTDRKEANPTRVVTDELNRKLEHEAQFKADSQRLFNLQNRLLSSKEEISSDEDCDVEAYDLNELKKISKDVESMIAKRQKRMLGRDKKTTEKPKTPIKQPAKSVMKIERVFLKPDGSEFISEEIVRDPYIIDAYIKLYATRSKEFLVSYAKNFDEEEKKHLKREKRLIQQRLWRIKRKEDLVTKNMDKLYNDGSVPKLTSSESDSDDFARRTFKCNNNSALKIRCGACGEMGHMRTNKLCKFYGLSNYELINKKSIELEKFEQLHGPNNKAALDNWRNYYYECQLKINLRRTDPKIALNYLLEEILNELRSLPNVTPFLYPVNAKDLPTYYEKIKDPMDIHTLCQLVKDVKFNDREEFLKYINKILNNSILYNGADSDYTKAAEEMMFKCFELLSKHEEKLMSLEKAINPLLDENNQKALTYIFKKLHENLVTMKGSVPFQKPVDKVKFKDYYEIIKNPMDLSLIEKKIKSHCYKSRAALFTDLELMASNCELYNGPDGVLNQYIKNLISYAKDQLYTDERINNTCSQLEHKLRIAEEQKLKNHPRPSTSKDAKVDVKGETEKERKFNSVVKKIKQSAAAIKFVENIKRTIKTDEICSDEDIFPHRVPLKSQAFTKSTPKRKTEFIDTNFIDTTDDESTYCPVSTSDSEDEYFERISARKKKKKKFLRS